MNANQRSGRRRVALEVPSFASNHSLLALLLLGSCLALILVLGRPEPFSGFWPTLGLHIFFTTWVALLLAAVMALLQRTRQPGPWSFYAVLQSLVLLTSVLALGIHGFWSTPDAAGEPAWMFLLKNQLISLLVGVVAVRYLVLQRRWQEQINAEQHARLDALQARIRPHFLFNTLNTIASLVRIRPDEAEQAVLDLSDLLRSGLRTDTEHTLAEELELVRGYLRIESQRLGERLAIDWRVEDSLPLDQTIPALLVQPLVENAVVHGISKLPDGGCLKISARATRGRRWCVRVENPWPGPEGSAAGEGNQMALDNIRQRLELAYGERASLKIDSTDDSFSAEIRVPISD
ncbi:MAG: sensor histidine kinase [Wenzhouxiangellaceae bacterium]|nr:sensor histidine kinase [Wenzhouxiangellaceae bacterium]